MWICDAGKLYDSISDNWCGIGIANVSEILEFVKYAPTIDPESLPLVRWLREELDRVTAERDEIAALCAKLILLCDPPQEWRVKLFRRHQGTMIGDYMGSGYPFVDSFNRFYMEFEETASDGAYKAIRKAVDEAATKRVPQNEE